MTALTGASSLIRLILRRERVKLPVWVVFLGLLPVATAASFAELYSTEASRERLAATVAANPTLVAFLGPLHGSTVGGLTAWRVGVIGTVLIGIMAILTMIRHTREDEETGRRELLGSTVIGRHAPLTAALLVTAGAALLIGVTQTGGLIGLGLEPAGALAFGFGFAGLGLGFAGIGAVVAQLTTTSGPAKGLGIGMLGLFFILRLAGDGANVEALTWLSPIGWFGLLQPFAAERWWILGLSVALGVLLIGLAFALASRRDVGAGVVTPRAGKARAHPWLSAAEGLAWRLQRGALVGWGAGLLLIGVVYGGVAEGIGGFLIDSPQLAEIFERLGGDQGITDAFFSAATGIMALIAAAYAIRSVLRMGVEEEALRAEVVLATATPRLRWASSHLAFAILGPTLMLFASGAMAGAAYGAVIGDIGGQTLRVAAAALVQLPAVWVLSGVAMAFYGISPQIGPWSWGVLVWCLLVGQLGRILQFPQWALNLTPFSHIPMFPMQDVSSLPLVLLVALALGLVALGMLAFRRRDIPTV